MPLKPHSIMSAQPVFKVVVCKKWIYSKHHFIKNDQKYSNLQKFNRCWRIRLRWLERRLLAASRLLWVDLPTLKLLPTATPTSASPRSTTSTSRCPTRPSASRPRHQTGMKNVVYVIVVDVVCACVFVSRHFTNKERHPIEPQFVLQYPGVTVLFNV